MQLSVSLIKEFLRCPRSFYYHRVMGIPLVPVEELYLGSVVHLTLAQNFRHKIATGEDLPAELVKKLFTEHFQGGYLDEVTNKTISLSNIKFDNEPEAILTQGHKLIGCYLETVAPKLRPAEVEIRLETRIMTGADEFKCVARVDMIDEDGIVYDLKTRARAMSDNEAQRDFQPMFTAMVLGRPIKFVFHNMTKTKEPKVQEIAVDVRQQHIDFLREEVLVQVLNAIGAGINYPNPSWWCGDCTYRQLCIGKLERKE